SSLRPHRPERVFEVKRSIRQGCPLSAMLYSLTVEPLAQLVNKSRNISGVITPAGREVKIFQYADDTTLVLREGHSVDTALRCLSLFCNASGAEVNFTKSVLWFLGDQTGTRNRWGFREAEGGFKVLGVWLCGDSQQMVLTNWNRVLAKTSGILTLWKLRRMTLRGKVVVINALAGAALNYVLSVFPLPNLFPFVRMNDLGFVYKILTHSIKFLLKPNFSSVVKRYGHSIVSKALWASNDNMAAPSAVLWLVYRIFRTLRTLQKEYLPEIKPVWSGCIIWVIHLFNRVAKIFVIIFKS
uniref:Reverse transcriptase domain-containing protein n=1 Tax=Oryzias melastigma TaxID=30732 RepID=A0A3B3C7U6_ORYME